ncbi:MAG: hypothetical protein R2791_00630 [Saprospiraceae bacterium]
MKSLKFSFFRKAKSILATAFPAVLLTCSLTLKGQAPFTNNLMHSLWNKNAKAGFAPEKPLLLKSVFSETHRKAKVFPVCPPPAETTGHCLQIMLGAGVFHQALIFPKSPT